MRRAVLLLVAAPLAGLGGQLPSTAVRSQADTSACPAAPARGDTSGVRRDSSARRDTSIRRDSVTSRAPSDQTRALQAQGAAIILRATASAREVRFASQPRIHVRLCGAVTDSVHVIERRNLPDPVQAGATYRDVYIAVEILGHLNADCIAQRIGVAPDTARTRQACASLGVTDTLRLLPRQRRIP